METKTEKGPFLVAGLLIGICLIGAVSVPTLAAEVGQAAKVGIPNVESNDTQIAAEQLQQQKIRYDFKLPKMFDFERYKRLYKRTYSTELEESVRRKIFNARAFNTFLSFFGYKYDLAPSYLSINHWSDRTRSERRRIFVPGAKLTEGFGVKPLEASPESLDKARESFDGLLAPSKRRNETSAACMAGLGACEPIHSMELEDIKREFSYVIDHKDEPGFEEMADALLKGRRRKRSVEIDEADLGGQKARELTLDDLIEQPVAGDSPADSRPTASKAADGELSAELKLAAPSRADQLKMQEYIQDQVDQYVDERQSAEALGASNFGSDNRLPDVVYKDHRDSKCFDSPRAQRNCGSCYIFATISFYEWLYCYYTKSKVKFSEQYVIDCGQRNNLEGCGGGSPRVVSLFVQKHGLELLRNYPYRAKQDTCPYDHFKSESQSMGYLKFEEPGFMRISGIERLNKLLDRTPIIVGIGTPKDFQDYGGGVDPAKGCDPEDGHAMLLIGRGREDGEEYWLFRNSFGVGWGEGGYYKMSLKALKGGCLLGEIGFISNAYINEHKSIRTIKNPHYEERAIRRRTADYLKHRLAEWQPSEAS